MKIDVLNNNYINEVEQKMIHDEIEIFEMEIKEEKERLQRQELIEKLFFQLLNSTPDKKDGVWCVGTCLCYGDSRTYKENKISEEELREIEFLNEFLSMCDFDFTIKASELTNNIIYVQVSMTLDERDKLEEFIRSQNDTKVLSKIRYK